MRRALAPTELAVEPARSENIEPPAAPVASVQAREFLEAAVPEWKARLQERAESRVRCFARRPLRLRPDARCELRDGVPVCAERGCAPGAQKPLRAGGRRSARRELVCRYLALCLALGCARYFAGRYGRTGTAPTRLA